MLNSEFRWPDLSQISEDLQPNDFAALIHLIRCAMQLSDVGEMPSIIFSAGTGNVTVAGSLNGYRISESQTFSRPTIAEVVWHALSERFISSP